jgi:hypothetical protein
MSKNCLRPRFTNNILKHLLNGTSVNVVVPSSSDHEADRFADDIKHASKDVRVLIVNMRYCRHSYQQFLAELWRQYKSHSSDDVPDLYKILSYFENAKQDFIIVLNHLDAMAENDVASEFNLKFYENLNALKNYSNMALLIITKVAYDEMLFKIEGKWQTSKLDIQELEHLPDLTREELHQDLIQRHPSLSELYVSHFIEQVQLDTGYDYALFDHMSRQLKNYQVATEVDSFIQQLEVWKKQYPSSKSFEYFLKKLRDKVIRIAEILKLKPLFDVIYKVLKTIFFDPLSALIEGILSFFKNKKKDK